jgi:glycosyltransferase involved in cell wall biosynthesis
VHTDIIINDKNGLLAETKDEWISSIERLIGNSQLCSCLGNEARKTVEERYSVKANCNLWCDLVTGGRG